MEMLKRLNPPTKLDYENFGTLWEVTDPNILPTYYMQTSHDDINMEWIPISFMWEKVWANTRKSTHEDEVEEYLHLLLNDYHRIKNETPSVL
jgi:hypothetical protein